MVWGFFTISISYLLRGSKHIGQKFVSVVYVVANVFNVVYVVNAGDVVVHIVLDLVVNVVDVFNIVVKVAVDVVVDDALKHYFTNHVFRVESG